MSSNKQHWSIAIICLVMLMTTAWLPTVSAESAPVWQPIAADPSWSVNGITCLANTTCIAVGDAGLILRSTDDGNGWIEIESGPQRQLNAVTCSTLPVCIAVGSGGLALRSLDLGLTWETASVNNKANLLDITCTSPLDCIAVGTGGTLAHTDDGARSWLLPIISLDGAYITGITCDDSQICNISAAGKVERSLNGGFTWQDDLSDAKQLLDIHCIGNDVCIGVGAYNTIMRSIDHGETWEVVSAEATFPNPGQLNAIDCTPTKFCVATSSNDIIFESKDAGLTWNKLKIEANAYFTDIACTATTCIVVSLYGRGILTRSIPIKLDFEIFLPITIRS